ncbi:MAG: glycosyltransferase family 4 protein [Candidatus Thermoplasmatota archaeon]|nr:glycosyltransferase family 4 protein [Candidatus Thermoplasmatota archaeon]
MKITSIGHDKVYPPIGCAHRSYYILKYLSEDFDVVLIGHSGAITKLREYTISKSFSLLEIPGMITTAIGALGYFLTKKPLFDPALAWTCRRSPSLLSRYLEHANESEILVFEGCWHFPLLSKVRNGNEKLIVYDAHNVEYILKKQVYSSILEKKLLPKIFALEKRACEESDIVLTTSKEEKESFLSLYGIDKSKIHIVPNGVSLPEKDRNVIDRTVLFIGGTYFANFEAAKFINDALAPKLPEFTFRIAGRCCIEVKKKQKNVELYGLISEEKKDRLLRTSELAINPIMHGAGVNVKMLEYMAYGMPIVTTSLGARGIEYEKEPFLISDLGQFDSAIKSLSTNPELMRELEKNARETIIKKYEWSVVTKGLSQLFRERLKEKLL